MLQTSGNRSSSTINFDVDAATLVGRQGDTELKVKCERGVASKRRRWQSDAASTIVVVEGERVRLEKKRGQSVELNLPTTALTSWPVLSLLRTSLAESEDGGEGHFLLYDLYVSHMTGSLRLA